MFTRLVRFGERGEFQPAFSESFSAPDRPDDESDSHRAAFCSASFEKGLSVALSRVFSVSLRWRTTHWNQKEPLDAESEPVLEQISVCSKKFQNV